MKWLLQLPLEFLAMAIAYLTNWLVVLFADEYGWLPNCLYWWQTYDNTLDVRWMVYEDGCTPKFAHYDYDKHYIYHYEEKYDDGTIVPGYTEFASEYGKNFTLYERFQRYICRVCWLYRNSNYGFSYYVNGRKTDSSKLVIVKDIDDENNEQFIAYQDGENLWNVTWCFFYCKQYCKRFRLRLYLGWKLKAKHSGRHMLAISFNPFKPLEGE